MKEFIKKLDRLAYEANLVSKDNPVEMTGVMIRLQELTELVHGKKDLTYPSVDDIDDLSTAFVSNLPVNETGKKIIELGYKEGLLKMLEMCKSSNN